MGRNNYMVTLTDVDSGEMTAHFFRDPRDAEEFYDCKVNQYSSAPLFKRLVEFWERVDYPVTWKRIKFF